MSILVPPGPTPVQFSPTDGVITDVDDVLTTTRAVRKRLDTDRPVPASVIETCLRLATHAPNAEDRQNWRWFVVTDEHKRAVVAKYYRMAWDAHVRTTAGKRRGRWTDPSRADRTRESAQWLAENLHRVPVLIIPCVLGRPASTTEIEALNREWSNDDEIYPKVRADVVTNATWYGSIFPAIWSLQLALRSRGLGSTPTTAHLPYAEHVGQELGIPRQVTQVALLPVAYTVGLDFKPSRRKDVRDVTIWNSWASSARSGDDSSQGSLDD